MMQEAMLYDSVGGDGKVQCRLCSHRCAISDQKYGFCGVRQNQGGKLYTHAYGETIAANVDPIEKKPLYHFLPGSRAFSIATIGCNFHCGFCQNWQISQSRKRDGAHGGEPFSPRQVVREALRHQCQTIAYTYTEPTIFFEYAYDTSELAKERGLHNIFVTNGYMTGEAIDTIKPFLDGCNVDLKSFRDDFYKETCRGRLQPVLDAIERMADAGIWVEVTTLVVPGGNDSEGELGDIARFIAGVNPHIPWHISRFHPDYEYTQTEPTPVETLNRARMLAKAEGLKFVYLGNTPGESADTLCPQCAEPVIRRQAYGVRENRVTGGRCPRCSASIAGVF